MKPSFKTPLHIIIYWILSVVVIATIIMLFVGLTASGGEQKPLIIFVNSIYVLSFGGLVLCLIAPLFYRTWFIRFWFIIVGLVVLFLIPIYFFFKNEMELSNREESFSYTETTSMTDNDLVTRKVEYYNRNEGVIRKEMFWRNGKRDSIWSYFSEDGKIIRNEIYNNDSLINTINLN